jgi:hypothetical protein
VSRHAGQNALVLLLYLTVAYAYFGLPLAAHPIRYLLGHGSDPQIFIWSFAWWPHAIESGLDPFVTHAIYAPNGINLVWTTSVPGLALLFAPLTSLAGPVASYNVAEMLMPAAAAFTAFLLCRHVSRSAWAGLVGGYLFGFSSYMLGQEQGHMHLTSVFLLPLMALAVVRYLRGEIGGNGLAWRLGLLYGLQFWLSTEVLLTAAIALACGLLLAYALVPTARPRLHTAPVPLLEAVGVACLVAAPMIYFAATDFQSGSINSPSQFDGDLVNFVVPTHFTWIGGPSLAHLSRHFRGDDAEQGAYLGIPTLVIVGWFALRARHSAVARYLLAALALAALLTLGTGLVVKGRMEAWLPWRLLAGKPLLDNILPARFSLYASLVAAAIVALWTAGRRGWTRWVLPAVAVVALVPDPTHDFWRVKPHRYAFFTSKTYRTCFPHGETVAIFPFANRGDSMLWQAESGFWFGMSDGDITTAPADNWTFSDPLIVTEIRTTGNPSAKELAAYVRDKGIDRVLSVDVHPRPTAEQLRRIGPVQLSGGVLVAPACGAPSVQHGTP